MKCKIIEDEWYPCYSIEDPEDSTLDIADIPDDKVVWVERVLKEFDEVNTYLHNLYEGIQPVVCKSNMTMEDMNEAMQKVYEERIEHMAYEANKMLQALKEAENMQKFEELKGKTITKIDNRDDILILTLDTGEKYALEHYQNCCESVYIEDICGDLGDLINTPILLAEEVTSEVNPPDAKPEILKYQDCFQWTFYKLATIKGSVTIRWYGESNGYYSVSVDFKRMEE